MDYWETIKELRKENNIQQKDLAKIIGIDNTLLCHYENGDEIIPLKHLITICNYFNVSVDYMFSFTIDRNYKNNKQIINKKEAGKRLKEIRKENKLTQNKLAKILNTVQPVIANYENGKHLIATPFLFIISSKYYISADYLLGRIDEPKYLK